MKLKNKKHGKKSGKKSHRRDSGNGNSGKGLGKKIRISDGSKVPNEQQSKFSTRKRHAVGSSSPKQKKKRVSFADDLEKTKIFDRKHKLKVTPSTANPGKSIIVKKEYNQNNLLHSMSIKRLKNNIMKADVSIHSVPKQVSIETKVEKIEENSPPKSAENSAAENRESETGSLNEEKNVSKENNSRGIRKLGERRKLQVTRKVKEKLLKMSKKERKMYIRQLRMKRKPHYDLAFRCKILWEKLRSGKTKKIEQLKLANEIYGMLKGKVKELIYAHDTCRVVECLVTNGDANVRAALFKELTSEIVRMAKSKYAGFFVAKMLKHGSAIQRQTIFDAFRGHCVSLLRLKSAAQILETAYNDYANAQQRYNILIEFYGVDFAYFKDADNKVRTLTQIIADDPSRKLSTVRYLEQILTDIVDKSQIKLSLTHHLLSDFFQFADKKQLEEMIDSLKLYIPEIVHTKDGVTVAMKCLWNSSAKQRKVVIKNFKGLVTKTCTEEFGHRFLIAIFDTVDDTVLVGKYLLMEVVNNIGEIIKNKYGLKVLHHLIHPRDPRFCPTSQVAIFKEGDGNPYSKKNSKLRYAELFAYVQKPFCMYFAANMDDLLYDKHASLLVLDMLEASSDLDLFERVIEVEGRTACYNAIARMCNREFVPCDTNQLHPIEHPQAHFVISKLLKSDSKLNIRLSDFIMQQCGDRISYWLGCNKGCFILLHMLENASETTRESIRRTLPLTTLQKCSTKGAGLLLQKIKL